MFEFFHRKKKNANPIFAALGADMHCHLVPGVDDGSKGLEETLECLRTMEEVGFNKVFVTPHFQVPRYPNQEDDIVNRFENLKRDVVANGTLNLQLAGVGGEYRIDSGFMERMAEPRFLLTGGGKYLLLELSLHQMAMGIEETIFDLQMKGYEVVLAHPERYPYFSAGSDKLARLKDMGVLFQNNILSFVGFYGDTARKKAFSMVEEGWTELLGTDMHNMLYAKALRDASFDRRLQQLLERNEFLNHTL